MQFKTLQIEYAQKSGFDIVARDRIRHIKTLPYLSVVQAVVGSYDIQLGDGQPQNTQKSGFFIAPSDLRQEIVHNPLKPENRMTCRWIFLKAKINGVYDFDSLYEFPVILPEPHKTEMHLLFNRLFAAQNVFDEYLCYHQIIRLLAAVATPKTHRPSPYVETVLQYIKTHYQRPIQVQDMARQVNISESHLYSVFKKEVQLSPIAYLNNHRLSVAADELLKTNKSVAEIAATVGIPDAVYFNKLFKRAYQIAPTQYRELYKTDGANC